MAWEIVLRGPESALEELTHAFRDPRTTIVRTSDGFVLKSSQFAGLEDVSEVRRQATPIVESLSGISRILLQSEASLDRKSVV